MDDFLVPQDDAAPIDFSTQGNTANQIDMTPKKIVPTEVLPTEEIAIARSGKYHLGLGEASPGREVLTDAALTGTEKTIRNQAAQAQFIKDEEQRATFIRSFIGNNPTATKEDLETLRAVPLTKLRDPKVIFEEMYAKKVIDLASQQLVTEGALGGMAGGDENKEVDTLNTTQQVMSNTQIALKKVEELDALIKKQSTFSTVVDVAADFVPFVKNYRMTNLLQGAPSPLFPGTNRQEQYTQFYLMEPSKASALLDTAIAGLASTNLHQAREFVQGLLQFSSSDQLVTNIGQGLDVATAPGAGIVGKALGKVASASQGLLQGTGGRLTRTSQAFEGLGDLNNASLAKVLERTRDKAQATTNRADSWRDLEGASQAIVNPGSMFNGTSSVLSSNQTTRLIDDLERNAASALNAVLNETIHVSRVSDNPQVLAAAVEETRRLWTVQYPWHSSAILGVRPATEAGGVGRLASVENAAIELGMRDASLFPTEDMAKLGAESVYQLRDYTIKQRGTGFYIEVQKAIDETSLNVFNQLQVHTNHPTPRGLINTFIGWMRSAEDTTARNLLSEGRAAQYGSSHLTNVIRSFGEDIGKLRNREDFTNFLRREQVAPVPNNPNATGVRSKTVAEFERNWNTQFQRLPTEQEIRAYFTYTQIHSLDYMTRNLSIYNAKNRLGLEMFDFPVDGVKFKKPIIEGKAVDSIHFDQKESAGIMVWDRDPNLVTYTHTKAPGTTRDWVDDHLNRGYKIVQLSQYGEEQLRNIPKVGNTLGNNSVDYVLVKDYKSSPLSMQQIPNRDGWHVSYPDDGLFLRQPNIRTTTGRFQTSIYYGDHNLNFFEGTNRATAEAYTVHMNAARELYAAGNYSALRTYLGQNLPISMSDFVRQFSQAGRGGILDRDTPFYLTRSGNNVQAEHKLSDTIVNGQQRYPEFRDKTDSVYNLYRGDVNLQFATERNATLNTVEQLGSPNAPVFQFRPSNLLDPVETINRSTSQLMRGRYMQDLQIKAAQQYVTEFAGLFDATAAELARNPFHYLTNAPYVHTADRELLAAARNSRRSILGMLGMKSDLEKNISFTVQRLSDELLPTVVGRDGAERVRNATTIVDGWALGAISDPGQFFRNVAFNLKQGLWNPSTFFKQANTFTHVASLAGPVDASKALFAATTTRALDLTANPNMLRNAAARAIEWGWTKEHFLESYNGLQRSGFSTVGKEHAFLGDFLNPGVIQDKGTKVLESSQFFFREGEQLVRNTAWHASYLEWRKANPTRVWDETAMKMVLNRADTMNVNMSGVSNAPWQNGPTSVTSQFFGYASRLSEQMLGSRLTTTEKMKIVATYSAMYGVPVGLAGTTLGAFGPIQESWFSALRSRGIDHDENMVLKTLNEGIPSVMMSWATDMDFNFKESYGPSGNPFIRDLFTNDKGLWGALDLLGGAGFKATHETAGTVVNLVGLSGQKLLGLKNNQVDITTQDLVDVLENATLGNQARKLYYALNAGEYHTKNEGTMMTGITKLQGTIMAVTGLEPTDISKMHGLIGDIKAQKKDWQAGEKKAEQWLNLWASAKTDDEKDIFMRKAQAELVVHGVPDSERTVWFNRMMKSKLGPDLIKKLEFDYAKDHTGRLNALMNKQKNSTVTIGNQ